MDSLSPDDITLFRSSIQGTRPIRQTRVMHHPPRTSRRPMRRHLHEDHLPDNWWQDDTRTQPGMVGQEQTLHFSREGVASKALNRLRRGDFATRCIIDLHGLSEEKAQEQLQALFTRCRARSDRHAIIVHGKGRSSASEHPVIKNLINWWLRQHPRVLAFCSALPQDGGTGAVYVLLAPTIR